jgi:molybdopterin converting factor small subunit
MVCPGSRGARFVDSIRVRVELFGAFRKYSKEGVISFEVPRGTTVSKVRGHLVEALRRECPSFDGVALVESSVLAAEREILDEGQPLGTGTDLVQLAVLPPVCGG